MSLTPERLARLAAQLAPEELDLLHTRKGGRPKPGTIRREDLRLRFDLSDYEAHQLHRYLRGLPPTPPKRRPAPLHVLGANEAPEEGAVDEAALVALLRRHDLTLADLAARLRTTPGRTLDALLALERRGFAVHHFGDRWAIERSPAVGGQAVEAYRSRPDGTYVFGFLGDTHLGSKYERTDVLDDLYRRFAEAGVDRVFHAGNWIDGEARFNRYDLHVHGMDAQLRYMAERYPARPGIVTYSVAGDDHEGWYAQREGVDIGRYAEATMREAGRADWVNLGYMEAYVPLRHAVTGAEAKLLLAHPGGGTAYALSYTIQKIIESLEGGEKPAVALFGHYHKMFFMNLRNVWTIQVGCTLDQTPFQRKKKIEAHVGGGVCRLTQDPETGAVVGCGVEMWRYFVRGYYNDRWSHAGDVVLPERRVA